LFISLKYRAVCIALCFSILVAALAACGGTTPVGEKAVSVQSSPATPHVRATLPPTWTPTFTATPAPPTATRTATPTPTLTPTLSAADICSNFWVVSNLTPNAEGQVYFTRNSQISLLLNTDSADDTIHFATTYRLDGKTDGTDLPGGQMEGLVYDIKDLPGPGLYDWSLSIQSKAYGEICKQSGSFMVISRESTRAEESGIR
jgi:hypothetical protein